MYEEKNENDGRNGKMVKLALVGIGAMGRGHLNNYLRMMSEGKNVELVAICDVDPEKFKACDIHLNLGDMADGEFDFSRFHCYTDLDEMLAKETELDMVSVVVPTYLHCEFACKCLEKGLHVFCEKPMARNAAECTKMIETAKKAGKNLMIGQCLRFWGEYEFLKDAVSSGKYGKVISGKFSRGGGTPHGYQNWYHHRELGGGAIFDQHVHDVDMVLHLFGMPEKVSSVGVVRYPGSNYDAVSTNYIYPDNVVINTHDDWCEPCGFSARYRVDFEHAAVLYDGGKLTMALEGDSEFRPVEVDGESAYVKEILYFVSCIEKGEPITFNTPEGSRDAVRLVTAEVESCDRHGETVAL